MHRLNVDHVRLLLSRRGWQQTELADALGASNASVSQWINGEHLPRPGALLKLAKILGAKLEELLIIPTEEDESRPLIAFRRKGQQKTTEFNEEEALSQAHALERVAEYLPARTFRPREFQDPAADYARVEELAGIVRSEILADAKSEASIGWESLVHWFGLNGAVLIPVFWGERQHHGNALHVFLPECGHTFIYINLDSEELDFKFWLAHEMAHMLTPSLVGLEEGEDFSDAFAGALLFPQRLAARAYSDAIEATRPSDLFAILRRHAVDAGVSLNTVYHQVDRLAKAQDVRALRIDNSKLHQHRRVLDQESGRIGAKFFQDAPKAADYVQVCKDRFQSSFFDALRLHLSASADGPAFVSRVLHSSLADAMEIHATLMGASLDVHHSD